LLKNGNLSVLGEFVGHLLSGTFVAGMLMVAAYALGELVHWLDLHSHMSVFSLKVLGMLENVITLGDALLYCWYVVVSFVKAAKEMTE
jgi:hypothetical protein